MAAPEEGDGRPCSMDVFAAQLFVECGDHFDRSEAITHWLYGAWDEALSYLTPAGRAAITSEVA